MKKEYLLKQLEYLLNEKIATLAEIKHEIEIIETAIKELGGK